MRAARENVPNSPFRSFVYCSFEKPSLRFAWHFHPEYELTLIAEGTGRRFVGDHIGEFERGDLVLLGPNLPHTWHSASLKGPGRCAAAYAQFTHHFMGECFFERPELTEVRRMLQRSSRGLKLSGEAAEEAAARLLAMDGKPPLKQLTELLLILDLLAREAKATELSSPAFVPALRSSDRQRMERISRFIDERASGPIALEEAAKVAHMSVSAFSRFFRRTTGKRFIGYVNEVRIGMACRMLIETDRSIAEIALAAGFGNLSNFNRRFLQIKRMRPREYRRQFAADGVMAISGSR
jgi:AraC-like DNA-binding protein